MQAKPSSEKSLKPNNRHRKEEKQGRAVSEKEGRAVSEKEGKRNNDSLKGRGDPKSVKSWKKTTTNRDISPLVRERKTDKAVSLQFKKQA